MKAVNNTLLQMLFYRPLPQRSKSLKDIYVFFKPRIFPGENNFIRFLEADTLDEQVQYAIEILKRLSFESNFPPPYNALLDVLSIENAEKNIEYKHQHIARDHFLHVSYLYMLGIYIFFYDKLFFEKIKDEYRYERKNHDYENKEHDCIKDFISAWKYFCLYHDVGYSIEKLSTTENLGLVETLQNFSFSFKKGSILKELVISSTIKAFSHLVILKHIINNSYSFLNKNNVLFERIINCAVISYSKKGSERENNTFSDIIGSYGAIDWLLLDKMYSNNCLKIALSVFSRTDFIVLAFNKNNGKQAFCLTPDSGGSHSVHIFDGCRRTPTISEIIKTPELVFYDDYSNSSYGFQFYLNTRTDYGLLSSKASYSPDLNTVVAMLPDEFVTEYVRINSEQDMRNFHYRVYSYFNDYISCIEKNSDLYAFMHTLKEELESTIYNKSMELVFSNETKEKIFDAFFERLSVDIQSKINGKSISANEDLDISAYVREYVSIISEELEKFIISKDNTSAFQKFKMKFILEESNVINSNLEFRISMLSLYSKLLRKNFDLFNKHNSNLYFDYKARKLSFDMANFGNIICNKFNRAFSVFQENTTVCEIVENYNVPFGNKYDHGVVSSYFYAFVSDIFNETITGANREQEKLLALAFNFSPDIIEMKNRLVSNYSHIQEDVFFALFIHNISPKYFNDKYKKYRTSIDDPFSYLGMLADSLQQWNRPHTIHPSVLDIVPNIDASNEYDIQIEDDFVVVYETNNKDIQKKLARNIASFEQYLRNPDAFVKCGYSKINP